MEMTRTKTGFWRKFVGDKAFYKMVLAIAIPIMIQNGITNFVSLLDNIMTVSYTHLVALTGKVKVLRTGAVGKPSLNRARVSEGRPETG